MKFSDYKEAVLADAQEAIMSGDYDHLADFEEVYDGMFIDDSITGNGSGSYTFNRYKAEENTADLVWDEEFSIEADGLGYDLTIFEKGAEAVDVIARCLALGCMCSEIETVWNERKESN